MKRISRYMPILAGGVLVGTCTVDPTQIFTDAIFSAIAQAVSTALAGVLLGAVGAAT